MAIRLCSQNCEEINHSEAENYLFEMPFFFDGLKHFLINDHYTMLAELTVYLEAELLQLCHLE